MTEQLTISRDWTDNLYDTKYFTLEYLMGLMVCMGMDSMDFTEFITGYNTDSYTDTSCNIMEDIYNNNPELTLEQVYDISMEDENFQTCYTVYRLWNTQHSPEDSMKYWKDSCISTLEGMLGD